MWSGALLSNIGTWMESVGLSYHVAHTTGKASWSAIVGAAGFLPNGVLGPIGSAMADRWSRRRVLVVGNALSALVAAILAVWVGGGSATPLGIAGLSFVAGCIGAFTFPSFQSILPDLVVREHLVAGVGDPQCASLRFDRQRRRPERQHPGDLVEHRQCDLDRMKPDRCRYVEIPVGMMDPMQSPQHRQPVRCDVLQIDCEVEHHHRGGELQPVRHRDEVEDSDAVVCRECRAGDSGERHGECRHQPQQQRAEHRHSKIREPSQGFRDAWLASWQHPFDRRHGDEYSEEDGKSDLRLGQSGDRLVHCRYPSASASSVVSTLIVALSGYSAYRHAADIELSKVRREQRRASLTTSMPDARVPIYPRNF